ncbi:hypothetical protein F5Y00DRAFT_265356 [Daldinia vernicosa]|uniref:uncharacterized protein n=1 Tax=Daldinia vernicosa TaxID=114800 RepID=UPI002007E153|nr:uncharacterized protein F5Y00DRAFT_265356 [Daldinia vernicosa]KAI0845722.1 hypothetical protein F5Y00DRAFT_265356 [Daldinia vernicosa]
MVEMRRYEGIWRKRDVLPFWILQILLMHICIVAAVLLFVGASSVERQQSKLDSSGLFTIVYLGYEADDLVKYARIMGIVMLVLGIGTLIFDIIEIVLYVRGRLNPVILLSCACIKTLIWSAYFITAIIAIAAGSIFGVLGLLIGIVPVATNIAQLAWGIIYTNRERNGQLSNRSKHKSIRDDGSYDMVYDIRDRWNYF